MNQYRFSSLEQIQGHYFHHSLGTSGANPGRTLNHCLCRHLPVKGQPLILTLNTQIISSMESGTRKAGPRSKTTRNRVKLKITPALALTSIKLILPFVSFFSLTFFIVVVQLQLSPFSPITLPCPTHQNMVKLGPMHLTHPEKTFSQKVIEQLCTLLCVLFITFKNIPVS